MSIILESGNEGVGEVEMGRKEQSDRDKRQITNLSFPSKYYSIVNVIKF